VLRLVVGGIVVFTRKTPPSSTGLKMTCSSTKAAPVLVVAVR
jgi:hypothetical protein